ncbi:acyl-CoA dehydrogenase [Klebsiella grimontii]|uniref:acyl-CoA dehydrogenase n=1 Tax=Klebsiella grimontii TaxID=2058152 RepID=UPI000E347B1D|nr:acyl-CoA dehydrogenase [Klebsiella grimontii]RFP41642.1 acyl-CoA dehydrogenase [Klebsiella oxytoca]MBZ6971731.1 acyl-CoA dehydrogenase [Klebsiella grimontii]MBZ7826300.1 acyl-CoA dehydrogenase [Klebsiella grimontii]MDM4405851.1 acyl-CoA dehydrogenase [Klebsiella grimontii]QTP39122.1 acyl-CoA dehydrogenase [Klebsiella grimontii]
MNKLTATLLLMLISTAASAADYIKPNAGLILTPQGENMAFSINSSYGDASGVCNMDGVAQPISAGKGQKHSWGWSDSNSQCVAVISEDKNGKMNVSTKECDGYCGMSAVGSMDGLYHR